MPEEKMVSSSSDERTVNNTFRSKYRVLNDEEKALMDEVKDAATVLESFIEKIGPMRETSIAKTKLEEAIMWAIKGLTK